MALDVPPLSVLLVRWPRSFVVKLLVLEPEVKATALVGQPAYSGRLDRA